MQPCCVLILSYRLLICVSRKVCHILTTENICLGMFWELLNYHWNMVELWCIVQNKFFRHILSKTLSRKILPSMLIIRFVIVCIKSLPLNGRMSLIPSVHIVLPHHQRYVSFIRVFSKRLVYDETWFQNTWDIKYGGAQVRNLLRKLRLSVIVRL